MTNQLPNRPRIFSYMTKSRFLHLEDALTPAAPSKPGKIRFFIGSYERGSGKPAATAYHFLDDADARVAFLDMSWGRKLDIKDYKGTGGDNPTSRVLSIKGPTDGKYWVQVANGPGQVIGAGAVKPAGKPTSEISIALPIHNARALALAGIEYMTAYRVTAILRPQASPPAGRQVDRETGEITNPAADAEELFGPEQPAPQAKPKKAQEEPPEDNPPAFYRLINKALAANILDFQGVQDRIKAPGSWREKGVQLQALIATAA